MVKLFPIIPDSFSHLLPEVPDYDEYENWNLEPTFDENGLLHSYDDVPVLMNRNFWNDKSRRLVGGLIDVTKFRYFCWYSHGKISRKAGKPPVVLISSSSYSTSNEFEQSQSYNGMPSLIQIYSDKERFSLIWHENGRFHRSHGLPAKTTYDWRTGNLISESFYDNGLQHRGDNLPSEVDASGKFWRVQGVLHNTSGYASEVIHSSGHTSEYLWSLYGVGISEITFHAVNTLAIENSIPLYVSFLVNIGITSLEHLDIFRDASGVWKTDIPATWVLRALNVTPEIFGEKIREAQDKLIEPWVIEYDEGQLSNFLKVIASETADAELNATKGVSL